MDGEAAGRGRRGRRFIPDAGVTSPPPIEGESSPCGAGGSATGSSWPAPGMTPARRKLGRAVPTPFGLPRPDDPIGYHRRLGKHLPVILFYLYEAAGGVAWPMDMLGELLRSPPCWASRSPPSIR